MVVSYRISRVNKEMWPGQSHAGCGCHFQRETLSMNLHGRIGTDNAGRSRWLNHLGIRLLASLALCTVSLSASVTLKAQDEGTRRLWDTAFINSGSKRTSPRKATKRSYRVATPNV